MPPRTHMRHIGMLILGLLMCVREPTPCGGVLPYEPRLGDPLLEPWRWRTFPELSGLGAQCLTEATDGTLWFGTPEGIWSYDGFRWTHYPTEPLGQGNITAVCATRDGIVYAGGPKGLLQFTDGRWQRMRLAADQHPADHRQLAAAPDGALWAATSRGAIRYHSGKATLYTTRTLADGWAPGDNAGFDRIELFPDSISDHNPGPASSRARHDLWEIHVTERGRVWLGTTRGELITFDPSVSGSASASGWALFNEEDGLVCGLEPCIRQFRDGSVWVVYGGKSGYLHSYDGTAWYKVPLAQFGLPVDCTHLVQTRDGTLWVSGRYVVAGYRAGAGVRSYQKPAVPIPSARNLLLPSSDGALWICGPGTEVVRIDYQTPAWLTYQDLNFSHESPAGDQWFLHRDGRVVLRKDGAWTSSGPEDGLIDRPVALLGTRQGTVWAAGSHQGIAATARFDGRSWQRFLHPELSWGVDWRAVFESSDGSLWFGAAVDSRAPAEQRAGLLQFRDETWTHHQQTNRVLAGAPPPPATTLLPATQRPENVGKFICLGESRDGRLWAGRNLLASRTDRGWEIARPPHGPRWGVIETSLTTANRDFWIGTRQFGLFRYDGQSWHRFQGRNGPIANSILGLAQTSDGSIWAATDRGFTRFDGQTWSADVLPNALSIPLEGGSLAAGRSGTLWVNRRSPDWNKQAWSRREPTPEGSEPEFWTVCHGLAGKPPETTLLTEATTVDQPGNLLVVWDAAVPWKSFDKREIQFSFRLDDAPWSPYTSERGHTFLALSPGPHRFEVRARDLDFNVDPTPATLEFVVQPPVWRQPWFLGSACLLLGLVATQSLRVVLERGRLRESIRALAAEVRDRQKAEAAVRESEEVYRTLIAASPDAITLTDLSGRITLCSPKALELLRIPDMQHAIGRTIFEWVAPEDHRQALEDLPRFVATGDLPRREFALRRDDGSRLEAEISGAIIRAWDGSPRSAVFITRDVTERNRAAESLRKLSRAVEQSPVSIVITDTQGRIEYVNPKFTEVTGYSAAEALGQNPRILKSGDQPPEFYRALWQTLTSGKSWRGEFLNRKKNGDLYPEDALISPIFDRQGTITHFVAVKRDVTDQKLLEEQLRQAQKLEAIGQLAGGVAHDFNNIVAVILMQAEMTCMQDHLPAEVQEALQEITRAAQRAADLTRQLLLFSRKQIPQPRHIDLNQAVSGLANMLRRIIREDVRLRLSLHPAPTPILADPGMIDQVLINLAVNARDAMPDGGNLTVETDLVTLTEDPTSPNPEAPPGRYVCLRVRDSGAGITPQHLPRIFDPFFTTKEPGKGTGLGLATVFGIVKQHRGFIRVDSEPGQGSCFQVFLPACDAPAPAPETDPSSGKPAPGTETILLVEDEPALRSITRLALESHGYRVLEATTGVEAFRLWGEDQHSIALLVTDLVMPGGLTGQQLARILQDDRPDLPVIFASGYHVDLDNLKSQLLEHERFLQKPFGPKALLDLVRECLDRPPPLLQ